MREYEINVGDRVLYKDLEFDVVGVLVKPYRLLIHRKDFKGHSGTNLNPVKGGPIPNSMGHISVHKDNVTKVEKTPLEICRERYKVGQKVKSAFGCVFTIKSIGIEDRLKYDKVIYSSCGTSLYDSTTGKYAEILEDVKEPEEINYLKLNHWYEIAGKILFVTSINTNNNVFVTYNSSASIDNGSITYDIFTISINRLNHNSAVKRVDYNNPPLPLEELFKPELEKVESMFPEVTTGKVVEWHTGKGKLKISRLGDLKFIVSPCNEVKIISRRGYGILWSTKYGYSEPHDVPKECISTIDDKISESIQEDFNLEKSLTMFDCGESHQNQSNIIHIKEKEPIKLRKIGKSKALKQVGNVTTINKTLKKSKY